MDKEKFFSGLWIIAGLILGSLFTNFVYQDYLAYGGQVKSLVFHNEKLYSASISLFRINVITSDHTDGNQRIMSGDLKSVSTFYFVWDEPDPACKTEFYRRKKGRNAL